MSTTLANTQATSPGLTQAEHRAIRAIADQAAPARTYFAPVTAHTGARHQQPAVSQTRHEWYFDANGAYQDDGGPIDAPDLIAHGSVRALDFGNGTATMGIAHVMREA